MNAQIVISGWTRRWDRGETELVIAAPNDVDTVGIVRRAIAAENNDWREDGKGFRKGRWFVDASEHLHVYVSHEDITSEAWGCFDLTDWDSGTPDTVREIGASFHDWHGATHPKQPAEPMGFGAVVKACELVLIRAQITDRDYSWLSVDGVRYQWAEILERGPVTVLSEGVTS